MYSKFRLLAIVAFLPFLFTTQSCDEIKDLASFETTVDMPAETFTVDSMSYKSSSEVQEWRILKEYTIAVNLQQVLDDNGVSSADFENGRVDSYEATLISPDGVDFSSWTDKMKVTASLKDDFSGEVLIAQTIGIDPGAKTVAFSVEDVDITSYIKADEFYLRVWAYKVNPLPVPLIEIEVKGEVSIKVNPI